MYCVNPHGASAMICRRLSNLRRVISPDIEVRVRIYEKYWGSVSMFQSRRLRRLSNMNARLKEIQHAALLMSYEFPSSIREIARTHDFTCTTQFSVREADVRT